MSIYLTGFTRHIRKHIKESFTFTPTPTLSDKELKFYAENGILGQNIPMFEETQAWIKRYYIHVADINKFMYYNIHTGLWDTDTDTSKLRNLLLDYFSILAEEAQKAKDGIMLYYARAMFKLRTLNELITKIHKATFFTKDNYNKIVEATEDLVYFETVAGKQALLDLSKPGWNLKLVSFADTQDLFLTTRQTQKLAENPDDEPKLFLSLIEEYMCKDKELIEYFHKVLAYLMSPYNYNQVVFHFYGAEGKNGKSTIVKVLQDILGPRTARISNQFLADNPSLNFKIDDAVASISGKSLIIFNEIKERMYLNTETFKKISDGGRDDLGNKTYEIVRPAFKSSYQVCVQGIPIVLANGLLNFPEWADIKPITRRLLIVPFNFTIDKEDPTIVSRLAAEYPQIQLWLYMNYFKHRGINIKEIKLPKAVTAVKEQYAVEVDSLGNFFKECFVTDKEDKTKERLLRSDMYRTYQSYCKFNGRQPMRNTGTSGFQNLIKPYLRSALGEDYIVNSSGLIYIKGVKHSEYYVREVMPSATGR
jgi:P4 family phage/plasmid primase-like protien